MTSTRFLIGVAVGAVGAWFLWGRSAHGIGGAHHAAAATRNRRQAGRNSAYSGLGRFR